jgi:DNA end-binding protein Ku
VEFTQTLYHPGDSLMPAVKNHRPPAPGQERRAVAPAAPVARGAPPARGRPSWSGLLRLSLVSVPVKAYPAVSSTATSPFHLLHAACGQRIRYAKNCPQHGAVEGDAIVRGYEYARDQFVVIEAEELNRLRPVKDRALILEQFLPVQEVAPTFFAGRSLVLYPDGPAAQHPYNVLVEALHQAGQGALGRVVLSNQRQLVLVRASSRLLVLDVLHYPSQVRNVGSWEADLPASAATDSERQLAEQLIALAGGPVDWERYRDTSAEELATLVEAKRARQPAPTAAEEPTVLRLLDALKQSVAAARQGSESSTSKARKPRARRVTA